MIWGDPDSPPHVSWRHLAISEDNTLNAFEAWNLRLLQKYFHPRDGAREVFLGTTPEELDSIGSDLGGDAGLLAAVAEGPPWALPDSLVDRVRRLVEQRTRSARRGPSYVDPRKHDVTFAPDGDIARSAPTYLPYLAILARNAAKSDKRGYYPQLRSDLRLPENWGSNHMSRMIGAWDDLQAWTVATQGKFGKFVARQLGSHRLIGLPKSQVIMSSSDIPGIHRLFDSIGARPGEALTVEQLNRLLHSIGLGDQRLSRALEQAACDPSYSEELLALLHDIHQGWTGATESPALLVNGGDGIEVAAPPQFGLCLHGQLPWQLQVRLEMPPDLDGGGLVASGGWQASTRSDRVVVATMACGQAQAFLSLGEWQLDVAGRACRLPRRGIWVLRPSMHGQVHEIWEGELSPFGSVYLLADEACASALGEYLDRARPAFEEVPTVGLPDGWRIVWLTSQELSDAQLDIPGPRRNRPRVFRLDGGTAVNVAGSRHYLHYDLPRVLVMAPEGAYVECDGERLDAIVEMAATGPLQGVSAKPPDPCFELPAFVEAGGEFSLRVLDAGGSQLGNEARIRVKDPDGLSTPKEGSTGAIDRYGHFTYSDEGLRGGFEACHAGVALAGPALPDSPLHVAGASFHYGHDPGLLHHNPAALFLDVLHAKGRISYGGAVSLLGRLMAKVGTTTEPWRVLEDLWVRGHLELERSSGATTFVHSVRAAVYELPIRVNGSKAYGVLGTLAAPHWRMLTCKKQPWGASVGLANSAGEGAEKILLPVLRISGSPDGADIAGTLQPAGIAVMPEQSSTMVRWSASLPEVLADAFVRGSSDPPVSRPAGLKLFNPATGYFDSVRGAMERPPPGSATILLYQCDDPHVSGRRLHVLASQTAYAIARDLRWGKWIATMLTRVGRANPGRPPIALQESGRRSRLWIPARLRLPPILERAIILCSGTPPDQLGLDTGPEDGGKVELILEKSRQELGIHVDTAIVGGHANGKWLLYSDVPPTLANLLRKKLRPA